MIAAAWVRQRRETAAAVAGSLLVPSLRGDRIRPPPVSAPLSLSLVSPSLPFPSFCCPSMVATTVTGQLLVCLRRNGRIRMEAAWLLLLRSHITGGGVDSQRGEVRREEMAMRTTTRGEGRRAAMHDIDIGSCSR